MPNDHELETPLARFRNRRSLGRAWCQYSTGEIERGPGSIKAENISNMLDELWAVNISLGRGGQIYPPPSTEIR